MLEGLRVEFIETPSSTVVLTGICFNKLGPKTK